MDDGVKKDTFDFLSDLLYRHSGLVVPKTKSYLLRSRLGPVARDNGLADIDTLVRQLRAGLCPALLRQVVEAMTTNESMFFRDKTPFEIFSNFVVPKLLNTRAQERRIRIWSAACSSGQEPYSLAMVLDQLNLKAKGWTVEIVATDLSDDILERAREGRYTKMEVTRGLSDQLVKNYFDEENAHWRLKPELRGRVAFSKFNLLDNPIRLGKFDIVFCRNVLIYFDTQTKQKVLGSIARQISPDGYLVLGSSETVLGLDTAFGPCDNQRGLYQRQNTETSTGDVRAPQATLSAARAA
jgi:chemotaxis protein methyltransferase CheR